MPPLRPLRIEPDALRLEPLDLDAEDFQSPLPVQNHHLIFADEAIGLAVGVWDTTTMQEAFGPDPGDEFITVLDGRFAIVDAQGAAVTGAAGQSATFRNGIPVSWRQDGYLRKIYLTLQGPDGQTPEIASAEGGVRVLAADVETHGAPGPDGVIREALFRNDAGTMTVWRGAFPETMTPPAPSPAHLLVRVLAGRITLTDPDGRAEVFSPCGHVFLPKDAQVAWATAAGTAAFIVEVTAP
jgi:uncharacterized cupin superfamily protein